MAAMHELIPLEGEGSSLRAHEGASRRGSWSRQEPAGAGRSTQASTTPRHCVLAQAVQRFCSAASAPQHTTGLPSPRPHRHTEASASAAGEGGQRGCAHGREKFSGFSGYLKIHLAKLCRCHSWASFLLSSSDFGASSSSSSGPSRNSCKASSARVFSLHRANTGHTGVTCKSCIAAIPPRPSSCQTTG